MGTIMSAWAAIAALVMIAMTAPALAERGGDRQELDTDGDGYVSREEFAASRLSKRAKFSAIDTDGDDRLSKAELESYKRDNLRNRSRGRRS